MKNKNKILISLVFLAVVTQFVITSCYKDKTIEKVPVVTTVSVCDTLNTDFTTQILPLISNNCSVSGCHDAKTGGGGYVLESYVDDTTNHVAMMKAIKADGVELMPKPPFQPFTDAQIQLLDCWISKGMPQ